MLLNQTFMKGVNRRFFAILLAFFSIASSVSADVWDGSVDATLDLSGSTIEISTSVQLARVAQVAATDDFAGKTLQLTSDLDLANLAWSPIGSASKPFAGTFDGGGHQIKNIKVAGSDYVGLFAYIGTAGSVSALAITGGTFEGDNYVGSVAGYNAGTITNCFAMAVVEYKNGTAGGLVGYNSGSISYVYTTGRLYKRQSAAGFAGGLAGENAGKITDGYSVALVDGENAAGLIGKNAETATLERLYWDKQMSNPNQTTVRSGSASGTFTKDITQDMYSIFASDANWVTGNDYYPELKVFAGTEFSLVSVVRIIFHKNACAGAVKVFEKQNYFFASSTEKNGSAVTWTCDPEPDNVNGPITGIYGGRIEFRQRCEKQEAKLTATYGESKKDVYVVVSGYDNFTPGAIVTNGTAAIHETLCFGNENKLKVESDKPALGGNENYRYLFYEYKITRRDDGTIDTLSSRCVGEGKSAELSGYQPADYGTYMVVRYARDGMCQLDPLRSEGTFFVTILPPPDAGAVDSTMSATIVSGNDSLLILSLRDASLDTAEYDAHNIKYNQLHYAWEIYYSQFDYATGDSLQTTTLIASKDTLTTDTSTLIADVSRVGEYTIYRYVVSDCNKKTLYQSEGAVRLTVFDPFDAGCISGDSVAGKHIVCNADKSALDSLAEAAAPTGGSGVYEYRWTIDGEDLAGADSAFCLVDLQMLTATKPAVLRRYVRDTIAGIDWQLSADSTTYILYAPFDVGAVQKIDSIICMPQGDAGVELSLPNVAEAQGGDEANIRYRWLLTFDWQGGNRAETLENNAAAARYSFKLKDEKLPLTIAAVRQVTDGACQSDWVNSRDTVRYHISQEAVQEMPLWICAEQLPYDYIFTLSDSTTQTLHFATEKDTVWVDDANALGCTQHLKFFILLREQASIDVTTELYACQTAGEVVIGINSSVGSLQQYALQFDDAAQKAGFVNQIDSTLFDALTIPISIPQGVRPGNYTAYLQFSDGADDDVCASAIYEITISVGADGFLHTKWNDVLFVDNNDKNGQPTAESDLAFTAYSWYKDGELVATSEESFYYEDGGLNGIYYAIATTTDGAKIRLCDVEVRPSTALVSAKSDGFSISPNPVATNEKITISDAENCVEVFIFNALGQMIENFNRDVEITAPNAAGIYFVQMKMANGATRTAKLMVR